MPLSPGDKLGPYEIIGLLGKGGMGEVYRGRDAKLNRDVAIKVLPHALAQDADYLARFQREAQTLAALNHPNIATIYGLEQNAIIMELVEGETLRTPLPFDEALAIAKQIAEALEAAHDKGIIHRDLKPGNIRVTPEGVVKVLDFGLAKSVERSVTTGPDSPTLTMRGATGADVILGTAGYMSPEQAGGKAVDRRADIWSFGVVLWELLTGKRLFEGETVTETLANVMRAPIDFDAIHKGPIRELICRCLDRNLKNRLSHIGEARYVIENAGNATPAALGVNRWPLVAAASAIAAVAGWGLLLRKPSPLPEIVRFEVHLPDGVDASASATVAQGLAISPDGRTLAFVAQDNKKQAHIYVRQMDSLETRVLPGTENAIRPFWSPDSKSLAFQANGKLKRIDIAGGGPISLCDSSLGRGGTWNEGGVILFASQASGLQRVSASGGAPDLVTKLNRDAGESAHYEPQFLPGGKDFLYLIRNRDEEKAGIHIGSLNGGNSIRIHGTDLKAIYDESSGRLLYVHNDGSLTARRLELNPPRLTGDPAIIAIRVDSFAANGYADISLSRNGTLTYRPGGVSPRIQLAWRDRSGKLLGNVGAPAQDIRRLAMSPDGSRVAYEAAEGQRDVWVLDLARGVSTRISFETGSGPEWSPDGKYVYYLDLRGSVFRRPSDGSGTADLVMQGGMMDIPQHLSPDGKYLLFGVRDIMMLPLAGKQNPQPYLQTKANESASSLSPDGRWMAYVSDESGRSEIYVGGFPDHRGKWLVSADGGTGPEWRGDGRELYWRALDGSLMAVDVDLEATNVRVGKPARLFALDGIYFAPARDGRRFLVGERPESGARAKLPMIVVQNWAAKLPK